MNRIQRLSITLAETAAEDDQPRQDERAERDDWLSRVGEIARRLRAVEPDARRGRSRTGQDGD